MNIHKCRSLISLSVFVCSCSLSALQIQFDYSHDLNEGLDFFGTNTAARNALEQAGADVSAVITSILGEIATEPIVGTFGSTTATLDAVFSYTNPVTGAPLSLSNTLLSADEFRIYVGTRNLLGSTLGQGGPGGNGYSVSGSGLESEWIQAMAEAEGLFNVQYQRNGPLVSSFENKMLTLGSTTANFDLYFGPSIGNLWFDVDTNNDGFTDDSSTLADFWHFDHTSSVDPDKYDFYSVALHEILHSLGFGSIEAWDSMVQNSTDWLGSMAIAELGTGTDVLHTDSSHIKETTPSASIVDLMVQEAAMDPNLGNGERKHLTTLDLAFMADTGWSVQVPEPGTVTLWLGLWALVIVSIRRRFGRKQTGAR